MTNLHAIIVAALFYIGWFGSVFMAKSNNSSLSLCFAVVLILFLYINKYLNVRNTTLAFSIAILGIIFDSIALKMNWITIANPDFFIIPVWLVSIWLLFSFSMVKLGLILSPPLWLAVILGFVMGPLSYKSGQIFGVLSLSVPYGFFIYGVFWALMFPAVLKTAKRFP